MLESVEALSKYKVSLGTEDQFANIMNFVKNMEIKDSKMFEMAENDVSKLFGGYLLKYFDSNLTLDDIQIMFYNIIKYNEKINGLLNTTGPEHNSYMLKLYGLGQEQNFNNSLPIKVAEILISDFIKRYKDNKVDDIDAATRLVKKLFESNNQNNYKNFLAYYLINNNISETETFTNIFDIDPDSITNTSYIELKDKVKPVYVDPENNNNSQPAGVLYGSYTDFINEYITTGAIITSSLELTNFIETYKTKDLIIFMKKEQGTEKKYSASDLEIKYANAGEGVLFFDIIIDDANLVIGSGSDKLDLRLINRNESQEILHVMGEYIILYKEFNYQYRNLLDLDNIDLILNYEKDSDKKLGKAVESYLNDSKNINIFKILRNYASNTFYAYDIYDSDLNVSASNKLFKYQYGNAYLARHAAENEVVKYYVGDPYISNKYGLFEYQKYEIQNFLSIYKNVRNYYYKVLLNEAFINDEEYPFFEKFFLIFWSVERFLSSKIDNLKNIDSYDLTDIKNFLKSFGFKKLSDIIDESVFHNSETYAAAIVKNYKNLINYKGSKKVIDILEKIFSVDDTTLSIYKYLLVKKIETNPNDPTDKMSSYYFVKADYNENNIFNEIQVNLPNGITLEQQVSKDKYWNIENTPTQKLEELNVTVANTKYLLPELTVNIAKNYIKTRCILAIIEYIFDLYAGIFNNNSSTTDDETAEFTNTELNITSTVTGTPATFQVYLNTIKHAVKLFINQNDSVTGGTIDTINQDYEETRTFKINTDALNNIKQYFDGSRVNDNRKSRYSANDGAITELIERALTGFRSLVVLSGANDEETLSEAIKTLTQIYLNDNTTENYSLNLIFRHMIDDFENYFDIILNDFYLYALTYEDYNLLFNELFEIFLINDSDKNCLKEPPIRNSEYDKDYMDIAEIDEQNATEYIASLCNELSKAIDSTFLIQSESQKDSTLLFLKTAIEYFISYTAEIYDFQFARAYNTRMENCIPRDTIKTKLILNLTDTMYYDEELSVKEG